MQLSLLLVLGSFFQGYATTPRRLRNRGHVVEELNRPPLKKQLYERDELAEDVLNMVAFIDDFSMTEPPTGEPTAAPVAPTIAPVAPTLAPISPTPSPVALTAAPVASPTPEPSGNRDAAIEAKCGVTALERSRDILSVLSGVSNAVDLVTPGSPQFLARDWLDNMDDAIICASSGDRLDQRYRAALLYYSMGGDQWHNCRAEADAQSNSPCEKQDTRNARRLFQSREEIQEMMDQSPQDRRRQLREDAVRWLDVSNECEWFGLDCGDSFTAQDDPSDDPYFPILNIDLGSNNLSGALYREFYGMTSLVGIFFDGNLKVRGAISEDVSNLSQLRMLDMDNNQLTGTLPQALFGLQDLVAIDVHENNIVGELSEEVGNLDDLEVLGLENNLFSGPLPDQGLLDLLRLTALTVEGNMFTGTLEPLCAVREERRKEYPAYLTHAIADCAGSNALVECPCCECN